MPDLLFLPGFMQRADAWSEVAEAVGERYPSKILDFTTWTFKERLAEIRAAASERGGVVGDSMGGRLALHAALRGGDAGVGLGGGAGGGGGTDERPARRAAGGGLA